MSVTYNSAAMAFLGSSFDAASDSLLKQGLSEEQVITVALIFNEVKQDFPNNMEFNQQLAGKGKNPSLYDAVIFKLQENSEIDFLEDNLG